MYNDDIVDYIKSFVSLEKLLICYTFLEESDQRILVKFDYDEFTSDSSHRGHCPFCYGFNCFFILLCDGDQFEFYCNECKKTGDIFTAVCLLEKLTLNEAYLFLVRNFSIPSPEKSELLVKAIDFVNQRGLKDKNAGKAEHEKSDKKILSPEVKKLADETPIIILNRYNPETPK